VAERQDGIREEEERQASPPVEAEREVVKAAPGAAVAGARTALFVRGSARRTSVLLDLMSAGATILALVTVALVAWGGWTLSSWTWRHLRPELDHAGFPLSAHDCRQAGVEASDPALRSLVVVFAGGTASNDLRGLIGNAEVVDAGGEEGRRFGTATASVTLLRDASGPSGIGQARIDLAEKTHLCRALVGVGIPVFDGRYRKARDGSLSYPGPELPFDVVVSPRRGAVRSLTILPARD
jgi:hypothetical protein